MSATTFKYKTIKARNITDLRTKVSHCKRSGWAAHGDVEIKEVTNNGNSMKVLMQDMIKYPYKRLLLKK